MGNIDILLNNFNHAGKLMDYPQRKNDEIKREMISNFINTVKSFNPKYTIPFASFHYYRAPESMIQNNSLMNV